MKKEKEKELKKRNIFIRVYEHEFKRIEKLAKKHKIKVTTLCRLLLLAEIDKLMDLKDYIEMEKEKEEMRLARYMKTGGKKRGRKKKEEEDIDIDDISNVTYEEIMGDEEDDDDNLDQLIKEVFREVNFDDW